MRSKSVIHTVEAHVEGLPVRVVTGGVPPLPGRSMEDRRQWFIEHSDNLRKLLMHEPRGHGSLSGAILQPPTLPDADWGVLFIEVTGVLPMCGAGTIGVVTVLIETGMVPVTEPITEVKLDTPVGLIVAEARVRDGHAESVTITNVPSYAHLLDASINVVGYGTLACDIAFGGNFYAIVESDTVGISFEKRHAKEFIAAGRAIMEAVNDQHDPMHPISGYRGCEHTVFLAPGSGPRRTRHILINAPGWVDRSPGGTGTSARMAQLAARGLLAPDTEFVNESILGTSFTGSYQRGNRVGRHASIIPRISGRAWLISMGQYLLDPTDPFPEGFVLSS